MDSLAKYSFLPWLRQGIATKITEQDKLGNTPSGNMAIERPELEVNVKLNNNEIRKVIKIHGPGDIIGINNDAIVRTHPKSNTKDFESNALAYIEFYEEDFPWRYTPALHANDDMKLRPWLALIVAKEGEYEFYNSGNGLPVLSVKSQHATKVFPKHKETWAWAHVHVNHSLSKDDLVTKLTNELNDDPDIAYSRLICPRRLEKAPEEGEGIKYRAFLIPAFETGRLAGLGEDPGGVYAQQSSWKANGVSGSNVRPYDYPVYYTWEFQTGRYGDFETLVTILKAHPLGDRFGKRDMSIEKPGYGLDGMANSKTLGLEGALIPPEFKRDPWPAGVKDTQFMTKLRDILNASQDMQDESASGKVKNPYWNDSTPNVFYTENMVDDPIVTPPIYAKWQALVKRIPKSGGKPWVSKLNLDPRNRATAAIGSQIVMKSQEKYMEMAWQQVGEINEANRKIQEAELAKMVNNSYYENRLGKMDPNQLTMISAPTFKYILHPVLGKSFEEEFTNCQIPNAAKSAAFKKIIRPGRKSLKRMNEMGGKGPNASTIQANILANFNAEDEAALTTAKKKKRPDMAISTDAILTTINCFLDIQKSGAADDDETLRLDPEAITSQQEYKENFEAFEVKAKKRFSRSVNPAIPDFEDFSKKLYGKMNPFDTMVNLVKTMIFSDGAVMEEVKPIMAYPEFPEPMFFELQKVSQDFIIPNISEIPENTITLLKNNQMFIEAFMAGLNHEMSRELLWREFPTDQRGSYFRNFWDDKDSLSKHSDHDILPMHNWEGQLGDHFERIEHWDGSVESKDDFIVLVIRGDVLKKYPNTLVYAQKAEYDGPKTNPRILSNWEVDENIKTPIFQAELEPDIALFGFSLTEDEARGNPNENRPGWFFVLEERPGHINFGLDDHVEDNVICIPQENAATWNELSWGHLVPADGSLDNLYYIKCDYVRADANDPKWGANSAEMASILYQNPVIFARHAEEMLP